MMSSGGAWREHIHASVLRVYSLKGAWSGAICAGLGLADANVRACTDAPLAAFCGAIVALGLVYDD